MKLKKHFIYKSNHQLWRILISETDKLIIETRDTTNREGFFNCYYLETGKKIFEEYQPEEKYWVGIETLYKDLIIFHKFAKPDMPGHKEIIVFDISSKNILWKNSDYSFLFVLNDKIYCAQQNFESRSFFTLDCFTGDIIEQLGEDFKLVNELQRQASQNLDYSNYLFPLKYEPQTADIKITEAINPHIKGVDIVGDVEYNSLGNLLFFNFHTKILNGRNINKFLVVNLIKKKVVLTEILNLNVNAFVPDSFFVYKNFLILLKEKQGLIIYKLE